MKYLHFEWDSNKNQENKKKHKISFEEAKTVFYDDNARLIPDSDHSEKEERFILLGFSEKFRILIVVHCYRKNEEIIRIISARKATKKEQNQYSRF
ncbi:MAG: BrnT family toxin [Calditrichaeota bacterium]|nr:MAG: BrnT family toxin [Calditrichota bacterium]